MDIDIFKSAWASWAVEAKKKPLSETLETTYKLLLEGKSIEEISIIRGFKIESVERQVIELITKSLISVDDIIDEKIKINILNTINDETIESLQKIKELLPQDYTYFQVKCTIASLCALPKKINMAEFKSSNPSLKPKKRFRRFYK